MEDHNIEKRQPLIDGLREFATFLEQNPDVPTPYVSAPSFSYFVDTREEMQAFARMLGDTEKEYINEYFYLKKFFGPVRFDVNSYRSLVCEKRIVGTKTIPAQPERTEQIVEWECASIFGDAPRQEAAELARQAAESCEQIGASHE